MPSSAGPEKPRVIGSDPTAHFWLSSSVQMLSYTSPLDLAAAAPLLLPIVRRRDEIIKGDELRLDEAGEGGSVVDRHGCCYE